MTASASISRPALRYHGGKWRLAPWIISHFGAHRTYVEPFGGGASVLLRKQRAYGEIYNDIDEAIVSFFRVLRDPVSSEKLERLVRLTPFARGEFLDAYAPTDDPVEAARRLLIRSFMGFGSDGILATMRTGFRAGARRSGTTPATDWSRWPDQIGALCERLRGVVVENRPALDVIGKHDADDTLFYVDPPYVHDTRSRVGAGRGYAHEMSDTDHIDLARLLENVKGAVVLSGYRCRLYDQIYEGWTRVDRVTHADGARVRVESLWLNARARHVVGAAGETSLFSEVGAA